MTTQRLPSNPRLCRSAAPLPRERAFRAPTRRPRVATATLVLLLSGGCGPRLKDAVGPPPPPPAEAIEVVGDGSLASGHFGPAGGTLKLGPEGPMVEIPAGLASAGGLSVALEVQGEEGLPAVARRIGAAFRATPTLSPPSGQWLLVRSLPADPLPVECAAPALQLALENATTTPGPALSWRFEPADWQQGRAVARLSELPPVRMQFVCATPATVGRSTSEETRNTTGGDSR